MDETKKLKDNYSSLINEMKSSNEKTLNEIKALNENQVRLLNILAGRESPEKKMKVTIIKNNYISPYLGIDNRSDNLGNN